MADHSRPHRNTYWVVPGHLLAGEYPGADDPDEAREKLDRFLACGIDGFVDLTVEDEAAPYRWLLRELASRRGVEVTYRRYPVTDRGVPNTPDQMDVILRQIVDWLQADRLVYVHCRGGVGRTGTVIGCYLVQTGLSGDEALERLQQLWSFVSEVKRSCFPRSPQTPEQASYVRNWPPV